MLEARERLTVCHQCRSQPAGCWRLTAPKEPRKRLQAGAIAATQGRCPLGKWGEPPPPSAQGPAWLVQPARGPIDVVYFLGPESKHGDWELRYSLRSVAKNFLDLGLVIVVGHRPKWLTGVVHLDVGDPHKHNKDANLIEKLVAAQRWGATPWFLNVSDDQIILKPLHFSDCRAFYALDLAQAKPSFWGPHRWKDRLKRTMNHLVSHGLPAFHHDCHVPFPIHGETFARVAAGCDYAKRPGFTVHTLYANSAAIERTKLRYGVKATYEHACRVRRNIADELDRATFLGYSDAGMTPEFMAEVESRFPEPSPWEADRSIQTATPKGNRGIVTLAGGPTYTLNAYILCRLLRHYGCELPIEWFYLGDDEMRPVWADFLKAHVPGLSLVDLGGHGDHAKAAGGWQGKSRAILESRFDELLFLDADSHPLRDPTYLFDAALYRQHGAIFWRDLRDPGPSKRRRVMRHFGVHLEHWSESGQMLMDKRRCLDGLKRADELNHDPASYRVVYGDKDLFPIGCLQTGTDFAWNPHPNPGHNRMMHPKDLDGRKLCSHLVHAKWGLDLCPGRKSTATEHYPMRDLAVQFGSEIVPLLR